MGSSSSSFCFLIIDQLLTVRVQSPVMERLCPLISNIIFSRSTTFSLIVRDLGKNAWCRESQWWQIVFPHLWPLSALLIFLGLKTDFESRCHGGPGDKSGPLIGRNLPEVVNKIVWVRQLIHKVTECLCMWLTTKYHCLPGLSLISMCKWSFHQIIRQMVMI